jgi:hypothetical protein
MAAANARVSIGRCVVGANSRASSSKCDCEALDMRMFALAPTDAPKKLENIKH